jgi:hypothetical protein
MPTTDERKEKNMEQITKRKEKPNVSENNRTDRGNGK